MKKPAKDTAKDSAKLYDPKSRITLGSDMPDVEDLEYIVMPTWWQESTMTKGLPFKKVVVIAGDSDSGKTSASIVAIKSAQEQGVSVLYVETEGKTTKKDFTDWGVDTSKIFIMQESIAEEIYDAICDFLTARWQSDPEERFLVVIDSIGNVLSVHDFERNMAESSQRPGGKGKANREGLNKLVEKRKKGMMALLLISYTYDNIGSPGKTNAGGKIVNFCSSLTYQVSRKSWIEATVKGEKVRKGATVAWKLFKNHIDRSNPGPKVIEFDITSEGFKYKGGKDD